MIEIAGIIILGIVAQWLAWRLRVPAILPLILTGLLVGPLSSLWTADGSRWIEPIYDTATGKGLFPPGQSLFYFVSLSIGIILFEGGLTLKRKEIQGVGPAILKLITLGSLVTFIGAGIIAHFVMNLSWAISFLFAGLIIVTGPTVIAPILRNVPLKPNIATVLKWEGILIDPIGALVAVLVFEFISSGQDGQQFTQHALMEFAKIILIGFALGVIAAYGLYYLIKRNLIPHYLLNVFTLALVLAAFVFSDMLAHESGLLTVVVMGMVMGNLDVPRLGEILHFKESLSVLLISMLFILLSANITIEQLMLLLDWRCITLFGLVVFILRPIGVFLSTRGSDLNTAEKWFISWVGPRGIVAAGIASLFGIRLAGEVPGAEYITPLVFMIVLGTVLLNATTASLIAKLLGVTLEASNGILIVGANQVARFIGKYLKDHGRRVVVVDSNATNIKKSEKLKIDAFQVNIYADELQDHFSLSDIGYLLAFTSSPEVNRYACDKYKKRFGEQNTYRLLTPEELKQDKAQLPGGLFSTQDDYINFSEVIRDYPTVREVPIATPEAFEQFMQAAQDAPDSIPIFIKEADDSIAIISNDYDTSKITEGYHAVYVGKEIPQFAQGAA